LSPPGAPASKAARFRDLLLAPELVFLMEAHDGLSAKIVEEAAWRSTPRVRSSCWTATAPR
jgi:phosphoenolpyruvate phosphomutase